MLQSFADEPTANVRNKIGDATAELARQLFDTGESKTMSVKNGGLCRMLRYIVRDVYRRILARTSRCLVSGQ